VSTNGQDFLPSVAFTLSGAIVLTHIDPQILSLTSGAPSITAVSGNAAGSILSGQSTYAGDAGAGVTLFGSDIPEISDFECLFGSHVSSGHWLSSRSVACDRPELPPGNYSVSLALSGDRGPFGTTAGAFLSSLILQVVQEAQTVPAGSVGGASDVSGTADYSLVLVEGVQPSSRPVGGGGVVTVCWTPEDVTGGQALFLAHQDNADLTSNAVDFLLFAHPTILSVHPEEACLGGTSHITVVGEGFVGEIVCRFGGHAVPGAVVSSQEARCSVSSLRGSELIEGVVSLELSINGLDFAPFGGLFRLSRPPEVSSVTPSHGPTSGGSVVTLHGSGFTKDSTCYFGSVNSSATVLSPSEVTCLSPPRDRTGPVVLDLRTSCAAVTSGRDHVTSLSTSTYDFRPAVELFPPLLPTSSGHTLALAGRGFGTILKGSGGVECLFGRGLRTKAMVVSAGHVNCDVSGIPAGHYLVDIAVDGAVYTRRSARVSLTSAADITSVEPSRFPGSRPQTVTITGAGFLDTSTLTCRFGRRPPTAAVFGDVTRVMCVAAGLHAGNVSVAVSNDGAVFPPGRMVTVMGHDSVSPDVTGDVMPDVMMAPEILRLQMSAGPLSGGSAVTVVGNGFSEGTEVAFSGVAVDTSFVSASHVLCVSPEHEKGLSPVTVSNNGVDFVGGGAEFLFAAPPTVRELVPPRRLLGAGSSTVTVLGAGFEESDSLSCKFGTQRAVPAAWSSSSKIVCSASTHHSGQIAVHVSNDATLFSPALPLLPPHTLRASLRPSSGATTGGTPITITLSSDDSEAGPSAHLRTLPNLLCVFGASSSPATLTASTLTTDGQITGGQISCVAPPARSLGVVFVRLRSLGGDIPFADEAEFHYVPSLEVFSAVPSAAPREGGTVVSVIGAGFLRGSSGAGTECAFGGVTSPADVVSSSLLRCDVRLDVTISGSSSRVSLAFLYHDAVNVTGMETGTCTEGARGSVDIHGTGFLEGRALWCVFGDITDGVGHTVGVSNTFRGKLVASGTLRCSCPSVQPGNVSVGVTADMHTVSYAPHAVEIKGAPVMRSVQPSIGSISGGGDVRVFGQGFDGSLGDVECVFGGRGVRADVVSSVELRCFAPHVDAAHVVDLHVRFPSGHETGSVSFVFFDARNAHVHPSRGLLTGGATISISLRALHLGPASGLLVRFGLRPALFLQQNASHLDVSLPAGAGPGVVAVEVVSESRDDSLITAHFEYLPPVQIHQIRPSTGASDAHTLVTVSGTGFVRSTPYKIGTDTGGFSDASFLSSSSLRGSVPPGQVGSVLVELRVGEELVSLDAGTPFSYSPRVHIHGVSPSRASTLGGSMLTIIGAGFSPGVTVSIAGRAAPCSFAASSLITCTTPASPAGVSQVTVAQDGMTTDATELLFADPPSVAALTPRVAYTGGARSVTLTGVNFGEVNLVLGSATYGE
ncbi:hypothetical protein T484DRAFT_1797519, partial [Baffinella frigidus]